MRSSFSFCGVDVKSIGLEYAPETKDTYVYAPAVSNVHEETFEGHDGGYSYGASKEPKTFTLRCFYEEEHVAHGLMARVQNLFRVGKKGMLIFERRPWCYYYATVTEVNIEDMRNYLNGIITITMKAYYPFARGLSVVNPLTEEEHLFCNERTDPYHTEAMENTALLDKAYMVPQTSFTNVTEDTYLLYNPGTERAKVDIVISGDAGDGVTINNRTTRQASRYVVFSDDDGDVHTDGISGKTYTIDQEGKHQISFLYHDYGFIELEPAYPILRELHVFCNGTTVTATNMLYQHEDEKEWYVGKYIYIGTDETGDWHKIRECTDKHTLILETSGQNCLCTTSVVMMNEIYVKPSQGTNINKLSFIYKPTYS